VSGENPIATPLPAPAAAASSSPSSSSSSSSSAAADANKPEPSSSPGDVDDGQADVVDFDALNAALGALPPPPTSSSPIAADSEGRSSATYSSARPHTIPPSHAAVITDMHAPAVIVAVNDETIPSGPPAQMTVPMGQGVGVTPGPHPAAGMPPVGPPLRPPSPSDPGIASHPYTPQPFVASAGPQDVNLTMRMVERPRRPRTPTIVVRSRGPTKSQKVLVFLAMLIVFVGGGIAFLIFYPGLGINLIPNGAPGSSVATSAKPTITLSAPPTLSTTAPPATTTTTTAPAPPTTPSASASAKKIPVKPPRAL
jgi:hypothetical protein